MKRDILRKVLPLVPLIFIEIFLILEIDKQTFYLTILISVLFDIVIIYVVVRWIVLGDRTE